MEELKGLSLLIVDDRPAARQLLSAIAAYVEMDVVGMATSGEEALAMIDSKITPQIILLDIHMSGLSGLETLKRIRQNHPHISVIMISGDGDAQTIAEAEDLGASGFIKKPYEGPSILKTISDCIEDPRSLKQKKLGILVHRN